IMILSILYISHNQSVYNFLKELKIRLRELSVVDDTLEALGAPNEYHQLRNWIIRILMRCIAYVFYDIAIVLYIKYTFYNDKILSVPDLTLALQYSECVNISNVLICGIVLGYTCSRFHQVNDRLRILYSDLFKINADYRCRKQNKSILVRECVTGAKYRMQSTWIIM
ncbi:hypothetical protein ALC62_05552, partial [Cyphomyrmex costatus]